MKYAIFTVSALALAVAFFHGKEAKAAGNDGFEAPRSAETVLEYGAPIKFRTP